MAGRRSSAQVAATLAWRYLWRNYRRTLIMLSAIAVATWAMIFMIALTRGMVDDMVKTSIQNFTGHVQVHHPAYRDDPSIVNRLPPPPEPVTRFLRQSDLHWGTRIRVPAVVSSERESTGVTLLGVSPQREARLSAIADNIVRGRFLSAPDDDGVVMGVRLAERLDTELGKRVVLMSQDPDNNIADRGFRVVGLYSVALASIEERFLLTGLGTAQKFLQVGDSISELEIQGEHYRDVGFADAVREFYPQAEVKTWYQIDNYLGTMLEVMDGFVIVWIAVIFLALSFGLVNTLVMAVFERVREIGLILALGMRPSIILGQVLLETLFLLSLGLAVGNLAVGATILPMRDGIDVSIVAEGMQMMGASSTLYPAVYLKDWAMANGLVLVLGLLAGFLPAWRASRYDPIRALNRV